MVCFAIKSIFIQHLVVFADLQTVGGCRIFAKVGRTDSRDACPYGSVGFRETVLLGNFSAIFAVFGFAETTALCRRSKVDGLTLWRQTSLITRFAGALPKGEPFQTAPWRIITHNTPQAFITAPQVLAALARRFYHTP